MEANNFRFINQFCQIIQVWRRTVNRCSTPILSILVHNMIINLIVGENSGVPVQFWGQVKWHILYTCIGFRAVFSCCVNLFKSKLEQVHYSVMLISEALCASSQRGRHLVLASNLALCSPNQCRKKKRSPPFPLLPGRPYWRLQEHGNSWFHSLRHSRVVAED